MALEDIPEPGMHLEIDAPEPARSEIVPLAGVRELPRLSAVFDLSRRGAGVRVTGQVSARVGQTCVVTLEPIENVRHVRHGETLAVARRVVATEPLPANDRPRRFQTR